MNPCLAPTPGAGLAPSVPAAVAAVAAAMGAPTATSTAQVLYVEDNLVAQIVMKKLLRNACQLTVVPTLAAARTIVAQQRFDLIISDFLFPDGDAVEFIVGVRRLYSNMEVPLLLVSASLDALVLSRVLKAGANDAMAKPLNHAVMLDCVSRLLSTPYQRAPDPETCGITTFQWLADGQAHEYCPELQLTVSAPTKAEVSKLMLEALRTHTAAGRRLGYTAGEKVLTHLLRA